MKGGDRFLERMTVIVTMIFTIFMIIRLLADRSPDPRHVRMIGLFSFVLHRYIVSLNTGRCWKATEIC